MNVVKKLREDELLFDASIAERSELPQGERPIVGIGVKLLHKARNAVGTLVEPIRSQIDFDRRLAHAHVVGVQRGMNEIVEMVGVALMASSDSKSRAMARSKRCSACD